MIEITHEETDKLVLGSNRWDKSNYREWGYVPWIEKLKLETGSDRLFLAEHAETRLRCISAWVVKEGEGPLPLFQTLATFEGPVTVDWPADELGPFLMFVDKLRGSGKSYAERSADERERKDRERSEALEARKDAASSLRKRGEEEEAALLESGESGWDPNPDEELVDTLTTLGSGKKTIAMGR